MSDIYLFDVDGTLTLPKSKMDATFAKNFLHWMQGREVYIVSGGSFTRLIDQLGTAVIDQVGGVFACMGNVFYQKREQINYSGMNEWQIIYENKFVECTKIWKFALVHPDGLFYEENESKLS